MRDPALLHLLDAMTAEAGRRGAYRVTAEVDEDSLLFETLRSANFAVYARQEIWRWSGEMDGVVPLALDDARDEDSIEITALQASVVPSLIQPVAAPPDENDGWVYRRNGRLWAHIAFVGGRGGIYLMPMVHREVSAGEARAILAGALVKARRIGRMPVYLCLRRYQDWLDPVLRAIGFESIKRQAVMVRQIAAGIRHPEFARSVQGLEAIPQTVRPPRSTNAHLVPTGEASGSIYGKTYYRRY